MIEVGLLVTLTARPGKEDELGAFLASALPLAEGEPETITWYAFRIDDTTFGIFDTFPSEAGRQAHIDGQIAAALTARADELLASPPDFRFIDVLASKGPV